MIHADQRDSIFDQAEEVIATAVSESKDQPDPAVVRSWRQRNFDRVIFPVRFAGNHHRMGVRAIVRVGLNEGTPVLLLDDVPRALGFDRRDETGNGPVAAGRGFGKEMILRVRSHFGRELADPKVLEVILQKDHEDSGRSKTRSTID